MNDIIKDVPKIEDFLKEMDYMKNVDIDLVYDQFKEVF